MASSGDHSCTGVTSTGDKSVDARSDDCNLGSHVSFVFDRSEKDRKEVKPSFSKDSDKNMSNSDNNGDHPQIPPPCDVSESESEIDIEEIGSSSSFEFNISEDSKDSDKDDDVDNSDNSSEFESDQSKSKDASCPETNFEISPESGVPWTDDANFDFAANIPPFKGNAGIQVELADDPEPVDVFKLFIPDDLVKTWVDNTNHFVELLMSSEKGKEKCPKNWLPVTFDEMMGFLAICYLMIFVKKPKVSWYWEIDELMGSDYSQEIMPHKRFQQILQFLQVGQVSDNSKAYSVESLVDHLNDSFKKVCIPTKNLYLQAEKCPPAELMPRRRLLGDDTPQPGYRFYKVCESTSGFVYNFEMYKNSQKTKGTHQDLVLRLMKPLLNQGYCLHAGYHFCSPRLCQILLNDATLVCGTVPKDCDDLPKDLFASHQEKGDMTFRRKGQVIAVRWKSRKYGTISTISTYHKPEMKVYKREETPVSYVDCMDNFFDSEDFDKFTSLSPEFRMELRKNEPFFYILALVVWQVIALLRKKRTAKGLKERGISTVFTGLIDGLTRNVTLHEDPKHRRHRLSGVYGVEHPMTYLPQWDGGERNERQCIVCARKAQRTGKTQQEIKVKIRMTDIFCGECHVGLCESPCFDDYHTKVDYVGC